MLFKYFLLLNYIVMPNNFTINRDMKHSLFYLKNLQRVLDGRATQQASLMIRKKVLDNRNKQNYQL